MIEIVKEADPGGRNYCATKEPLAADLSSVTKRVYVTQELHTIIPTTFTHNLAISLVSRDAANYRYAPFSEMRARWFLRSYSLEPPVPNDLRFDSQLKSTFKKEELKGTLS